MSILDQFSLTGRRAVITGGSRGLGLEMARALGEAGAELILVGSDEARLAAAVQELRAQGHQVHAVAADLSLPAEAEHLCSRLLAEFPVIDILVNNVGGRRINTPTEELPLEDWQRIMDLNLTQVFLCTKLLGGAMLKRGWGRVINIASINALWPGKAMRGRAYETSKAAVAMFTRAVAADWAAQGVTVNCIAPGPFLTDANKRWIDEKPAFEAEVAASVPMGRWGDPREIGGLVVYLASEASSYMTGSVLVLDGGKLLW
ncbi:MAG: Short-chain dehydrogenase [Verrucomicrobiaceae bacterium]|nr:Short-chain dehydrogenase [Verrucomicrobiaceae bacterium]